ncbi:MAG: hypothetical protein COB60_02860 [Flavobacteriaceae bacterium]|nr:MAG: hypothetical protein COB60_02860 [Flavobacteriaceae bacterium]
MKRLLLLLAIAITSISHAQEISYPYPELEDKKYNEWYTMNTFDDLGDVNGTYKVYKIHTIYEAYDALSFEAIEDIHIHVFQRDNNIEIEIHDLTGSKIKFVDGKSLYGIKVRARGHGIEKYRTNAANGNLLFKDDDDFNRVIRNGNKEYLEVVIFDLSARELLYRFNMVTQ